MQARHVQLFKIFCGAVALVHFTFVRPHSTRLGSVGLDVLASLSFLLVTVCMLYSGPEL